MVCKTTEVFYSDLKTLVIVDHVQVRILKGSFDKTMGVIVCRQLQH